MPYRSSKELRKRKANSIVCQPSRIRFSSAQPRTFLDAQHLIRVSKLGLKCLFFVASAFFNEMKTFSSTAVPTNFVFFIEVLREDGRLVID